MLRSTILSALLAAAALLSASPLRAAEFTVNSTSDEPDANLSDVLCAGPSGFCTLRAAIQEANDSPGYDVVRVPPGTYTLTIPGSEEDASATGDLDVTDAVQISGFLPSNTVIDGGALDRVFDLRAGADIYVSAFTVRNGASNEGGGVRSLAPDVTLNGVQIESNLASNGSAGRGGGLYVASGSSVLMSASAVVDNDVCAGGFFCVGGGVYSDGTLRVNDSTIAHNGADVAGGLCVDAGTAQLANVTIAANEAAAFGGGIVVGGGSVAMANTLVADNTAPADPDCSGSLDSDGYNLVEAAAGCTIIGDPTGVQTGVDPGLEAYALTEIGTGALKLGPASHAIDAGNPLTPGGAYPACGFSDQRFYPREGAVPCDLGAHERAICPTVMTPGACKQASAGKSSLLIKTPAEPAKTQLKWKWMGEATSDGELGDGSADYALCGYYTQAASFGIYGQFIGLVAPGGGSCGTKPCWKDSLTGLAYKDKAASPDGLTAINLKGGIAGKAKLGVQAKGALAQIPLVPPYGPTTTGIAMQLRKADGTCWETVFTTPKKDVDGMYQAKN